MICLLATSFPSHISVSNLLSQLAGNVIISVQYMAPNIRTVTLNFSYSAVSHSLSCRLSGQQMLLQVYQSDV